MGSWDRVLHGNSVGFCGTCPRVVPFKWSEGKYSLPYPVRHWLGAASKLAAQDKHPVETRKIPKAECPSVHKERPLVNEEGQGWGLDSFSLHNPVVHWTLSPAAPLPHMSPLEQLI